MQFELAGSRRVVALDRINIIAQHKNSREIKKCDNGWFVHILLVRFENEQQFNLDYYSKDGALDKMNKPTGHNSPLLIKVVRKFCEVYKSSIYVHKPACFVMAFIVFCRLYTYTR